MKSKTKRLIKQLRSILEHCEEYHGVGRNNYNIEETVNAEKLFAIEDQIATIENQLFKIRTRINNEAPNTPERLFKDRDKLEYQLKGLKQKREKILNETNTQINYYGVQYRNMRTGIHQLLYTDTKEKAQKILNYLNKMEKLGADTYSEQELEHQINFLWEEINKLHLGGFEINYRHVKEDGMYDDIFIINYANIKPDIYESLNGEILWHINKDCQEKLNEDQYESPDEEEFYTVTFTDGTTDNGFSYADGELFYDNEFIADIIDADIYPEITDKIVTYCEIELDKEVESIMDGAGQVLESLNEEVKEWEHNGHKFKEIVVDTKDVEVIPGLTIKFNKVEHGEDDVYTRTTWELDRSVDTNAANEAIRKHIIQQLGVDDYRIGGWSGAIPLIINIEED